MAEMDSHRNLTRVRVALFDAVGTLLFANPPVADIYHAVGRRHGSRLFLEQIAPRFAAAFDRYRDTETTDELRERNQWQAIVRTVFDDVPEVADAIFRELWDHFAHPESWSLFDDVEPVWSELERRAMTVGIASNFDARLALLCRAISPLDRASHVFYSSRIGYPKPRRPFFAFAQRQLHVAPAEILLVGDDPIADYGGAHAAGWQALLLDRRGTARGMPTIRSLTQLLELLP